MSPIEKAAIMGFGAALAVVGVILFAKKQGHAEGTSKIKFGKIEFELSTPSLFIFLIGCGLFVFPFFAGESPNSSADSAGDASFALSALSGGSGPDTMPSSDATAQRQAELEAKLVQLQSRLEQAERSGARASAPAAANASFDAPAVASIAGRWNSNTGSFYVIQQFGANVAIQEYTNGAISAVGEGLFDGETLDASFQTLVGNVSVELDVSPDGRRLSGDLTYVLTGTSLPFEIYR
jgi:hypothetical protein